MTRPGGGFLGLLRAVALIAVVVGAAGSVGLMLRVGHRNDSTIPFILLVFFTIWVLSPFVALVVIEKRWSVLDRAILHGVMLIASLGSLAIYGHVALSPPRPKPASTFLVVPLGSWLLVAMVVAIAALVRRRAGRGGGA